MTERLAFDRREGVLVARVSGEIDISTADEVQEAILEEAGSAIDGGLVVDLSDVGFLDSSGVRLLFSLHRVLTEQGRPMALVVPEASRIRSVLSIVDIARVVWLSPTLDGAIDKLFASEEGDGAQRS